MKKNQRLTIKKSFELTGIGLHTGKEVNVCFKPSNQRGILFKRIDLQNRKGDCPNFFERKNGTVHVDTKNVINTNYSIDISSKDITIKSVEHILAGLFGVGIDDCIIELNQEELPAFDGSAEIIASNILKVGLKESIGFKREIYLNKPLVVSINGSCIIAIPDKKLKISIAIDYPNKFIGTQYAEFKISRNNFIREIASAKTFGWFEEIEKEKKKGLIKGGSLNNALVYSKDGLINKEIQKFNDEVVRHKILDLIGALAFLNGKLNAHLIGIKTGHTIDIKFVKEVLKCRN